MDCEVIHERSAIQSLEAGWNALAAHFPNPVLRYEWSAACADTWSDRLAVFVVRSGSEVCALVPFAVVERGGIRSLRQLGYQDTPEPGGLIYRDEESLRTLLRGLFRYRLPFQLDRLPADSPELRILDDARPGLWLRLNRNGQASFWVPLDHDWSKLEARMSASTRSKIRRYRKAAERLGKFEFIAVSPSEADLEPHLNEVFKVEGSGWKQRAGTALLTAPAMQRFYTLYARAAARANLLRLFFIRIGGETAAVHYTVEHGGRLWGLKIGYDERWRECAPGILVVHETLRYACQHGVEGFEFLGAAEGWERRWTDQMRQYVSPVLYPLSLGGGLQLSGDIGRAVTKRVARQIRLRLKKNRSRSNSVQPIPTDSQAEHA